MARTLGAAPPRLVLPRAYTAVVPWELLLALPWDVEWEVPQGCPSEAAFVRMVEAEVETQTSSDAHPVLSAEVKIETLAQRWRLELRLRRAGEIDTRSFEAESCEAAVRAAALVVSLRLIEWVSDEPIVPEPEPDPLPTLDPRPVLPLTTGPVEEESVSSELSNPLDRPTPRNRPTFELGGWLGLHGGVAFGVAPGVGAAASLEAGVKGHWWRAGLAVHTVPRRTRSHPNRAEVVGRFDLVQAELLGCGVPATETVEFPLCGRLAGGGLRGTGEGAVTRSEPAWGPWWGVGGSAGVAWHVTDRLAPAFTIEALASLREWAFSVGSVPGDLYATGPVAAHASLGLEIHL